MLRMGKYCLFLYFYNIIEQALWSIDKAKRCYLTYHNSQQNVGGFTLPGKKYNEIFSKFLHALSISCIYASQKNSGHNEN